MIWTDEQRAKIKDLWLGGLSATLIGRRYGVSRNSIIGVTHRMGLRRDAPTIPIRDSAKWTPEMDAKLRVCVNARLTRSAMADQLGLTYNQVLSRCRTLKLKVVDGRSFTLAPFGKSGASGNGSDKSRRLKELGQQGAPARIIDEPPDPTIKGLTCVEMPSRGACRWPMTGAGVEMVMCGQKPGEHIYCGKHHALAFTPSVVTSKSLYRAVRRYA